MWHLQRYEGMDTVNLGIGDTSRYGRGLCRFGTPSPPMDPNESQFSDVEIVDYGGIRRFEHKMGYTSDKDRREDNDDEIDNDEEKLFQPIRRHPTHTMSREINRMRSPDRAIYVRAQSDSIKEDSRIDNATYNKKRHNMVNHRLRPSSLRTSASATKLSIAGGDVARRSVSAPDHHRNVYASTHPPPQRAYSTVSERRASRLNYRVVYRCKTCNEDFITITDVDKHCNKTHRKKTSMLAPVRRRRSRKRRGS